MHEAWDNHNYPNTAWISGTVSQLRRRKGSSDSGNSLPLGTRDWPGDWDPARILAWSGEWGNSQTCSTTPGSPEGSGNWSAGLSGSPALVGLGQSQNHRSGPTMLPAGPTSTGVEGDKRHPVEETNKPDYTAVTAYRVISLLNCLG